MGAHNKIRGWHILRPSYNHQLSQFQDMEQMERGHQWLFSCYSPAKDCTSIPGMDDISPEEMRFEAYQVLMSKSFFNILAKS
jgi:hypothetical protein